MRRVASSPGSPTRLDQLSWMALALGALAVLALARWLEPAASGFGTHQQLGLPPCPMRFFLHVPCPACGLTTAFAHLARGELAASLAAHPLGCPLFLLTCLTPCVAWIGLARGESPLALLGRARVDRVALLLSIAAGLVWCVRLS